MNGKVRVATVALLCTAVAGCASAPHQISTEELSSTWSGEKYDDLLIVAGCVSGMLNRVHPDVVRSHWSGQGDVLDALAQVTDLVEDQVIGNVRSTLGRLVGGKPTR